MFFQGTLQEGISTALQQSKRVVCFVTDDDEESQLWETQYLTADAVKRTLKSQAITLRLQAGSQEAGYLEALFPVPRKPTVVVIQDGQLKEYIAGGTSQDEFLRRINLALGGELGAAADESPQSGTSSSSDNANTPLTSAEQDHQPSARIQALLAERAARLEADKKAKEAAAKAEAKKRAEERQATDETNEGQHKNINAAENKYAAQLRKKKQDEKAERQRILRRIEDDKKERREREAQERQARLLLAATGEDGSASAAPRIPQEPIQLPNRGGGAHCNLQIRLLDGSTIRNQFPSDAKLGEEVREWVDENRTDSDEPYTFRILLTPLPNKAIESSEEADTLLDLGLAPSATLVLIPRVRVATAFQGTGGALYRAWSGIWTVLAMILSLPLRLVGGSRPQAESGIQVPMENLDGQGSARRHQDQRFRGFENADNRGGDQQFYNGNSVNFEPRRDDDEQSEI